MFPLCDVLKHATIPPLVATRSRSFSFWLRGRASSKHRAGKIRRDSNPCGVFKHQCDTYSTTVFILYKSTLTSNNILVKMPFISTWAHRLNRATFFSPQCHIEEGMRNLKKVYHQRTKQEISNDFLANSFYRDEECRVEIIRNISKSFTSTCWVFQERYETHLKELSKKFVDEGKVKIP